MEIFLVLLFVFCCLAYYLNNFLFNYWKRRNFPQAKTQKFFFGNAELMLKGKRSFGDIFTDLYQLYKNERFIGVYLSYRPVILVNDPVIIQDIMIRNFNSFHDRPVPCNVDVDPLTGNLFFIKGQKWRDLRVKISPTFSSSKIKMMFPIMHDCGKVLENYIKKQMNEGQKIFEFRDLCARLTTNIIASVGFGLDKNDCINNRDDIFRKMGLRIFDIDFKQGIKNVIGLLMTPLFEKLRIRLFPEDVEQFFASLVADTVDYREKNNYYRNDFMQLMIQLKNENFMSPDNDENQELKKFTMNELVAQVFVFFIAGFETSSSTMSYVLLELSKNLDVQRKVQAEIDQVMEKAETDEITYELLNEMKYLDCCIDETLRKWPIIPVLFRMATNDYQIPGSDAVIEKGTAVYIPVLGMHRDHDIFEDPMTFKPERFLNSADGNGKVKGAFYLPFGVGGRICIGARMGKLQTKLGLAQIMQKFTVECLDKKLKENDVTFNPTSFIITPIEKFNLTVSLR
ncbi:hypothetical protein PVAND_010767 [Polypedilum vanderplanki]|uniref:Cytochrome P450 n=1 Tax=Polypedilum vanderplanki TaxID=319348 RepID=A0A9J6CIB5_POLVA|nr:hypothetical protein PVAND_010767 [Polypedilum vanderplanki]